MREKEKDATVVLATIPVKYNGYLLGGAIGFAEGEGAARVVLHLCVKRH